MLVTPTMTPSEQASILYMAKILMSVAGFVVFCFGAVLYLYVRVRDRGTAAARLRPGTDSSERGREAWGKRI